MVDARRISAPWAMSACAAAVVLSMANGARAEDAAAPVDKSQYTLFDPTPDAAMRPFEPERPAKASNPFTVDAGHFQIESDFFNYTHTNYAGFGSTAYVTADPTVKLGLTSSIDLEVDFTGYANQATHSNLTGALVSNGYGFGDTFFKAKVNLFGNDGGDLAFAVIPYAKAPSAAPGLGNGLVEGGLIAPCRSTCRLTSA